MITSILHLIQCNNKITDGDRHVNYGRQNECHLNMTYFQKKENEKWCMLFCIATEPTPVKIHDAKNSTSHVYGLRKTPTVNK